MKTYLLTLLIFSTWASAQDQVLKKDTSGINVSDQAEYKRIMDICRPAVDSYYEKNSGGESKEELMRKCVLAGTVGQAQTGSRGLATEVGGNLDKLTERKEDGLICKTKDGKYECKPGTEGKEEIYNQDTRVFKSPELEALGKYFEKQLQEALYGVTEEESKEKDPKKKKQKNIVDQAYFVDLYKTEVGKTIISALTNYCIEADDDGVIPDKEEDRKKNKEDNLKALREFGSTTQTSASPVTQAPGPAGNLSQTPVVVPDDAPKAYRKFEKCIVAVKYICYEGKLPDPESTKTVRDPATQQIIKMDTKDISNFEKSMQDRACVVMNGLKKLRTTLTDLESSEEQFKKLKEDHRKNDAFNIAHGTSNFNNQEVDAKLELTSDWVEKSGTEQALKKAKEDFTQKCQDNPSSPECLRLSGQVSEKDFEKIKEEYEAKTTVQVAKIEAIDSEEKLEQFYQSAGLNEEEAKKKTKEILQATNEKFDLIRDTLNTQYKKERDAVVAEMNKRFNREILAETAPSGNPQAVDPNQDKAKNILEELNTKSEDYKRLIHYTNVVQSFLQVEDPTTGKKSKNTKTLRRELEGHGFKQEIGEDGQPLPYNNQDVEKLNAAIKERGIAEETSESAVLKKDDLKLIIDHDPTAPPEPAAQE